MCGHCGYFLKPGYLFKNGDAVQKRMLDSIRSRGPDGRGTFESLNRRVFLGHHRLAVIDTDSKADQPMFYKDFVLVYNGEIYNYLELKQDLIKRGHQFQTTSDTEVLLHLFEEFGEEMLPLLRGMFSFALFHQKENYLFCARDPMGKKPFIYSRTPDGFFFGSTVACLKETQKVSLEINPLGLAYYYSRNFRHIPEPHSLYKSISKLLPGHSLRIDDRGEITLKRFYKISPKNLNRPFEPQILKLLTEAVFLRLRSDIPLGLLLSGGVDSSAIAKIAGRYNQKISHFSLALNRDEEELKRGERVSKSLGKKLDTFYFDPDESDSIHRHLMKIHGEPVALGPLTHSAFLLKRMAQQGVRVVLVGHGADEVFFGYNGTLRQYLFSVVLSGVEICPPLKKIFGWLGNFMPDFPFLKFMNLLGSPSGLKKGQLYRDFLKSGLKKPPLKFLNDLAPPFLQEMGGEKFGEVLDFWENDLEKKDYITRSHYVSLMCENVHSVTLGADLPGMAYGVEVRCPFLDRELVEFGFGIPSFEKVGFSPFPTHNKKILKKALKGILPEGILYAPKKGFGYTLDSQFNSEYLYKINRTIFNIP